MIELSLPPLGPTAGYAIAEFRRGHAGPPLVTVVAMIELDASGAIGTARLGVSGASEVPLRLADEEALLAGRAASPQVFAEAAERAARRVSAGDPVLADAELRRRATRALLARALAQSAALAAARRGRKEEQA